MSSEFSRMQLNDYVEALGSGAPTPGGGGASALWALWASPSGTWWLT